MKLCPSCKEQKQETEFNLTGNKLQSWCKSCQCVKAKKQYEANKEEQKKKIEENRKKRRSLLQQYLLDRFKSGCLDCGITDPRVLEWDHVNGKSWDISKLIHDGASIERAEKELAKCELVCSNCHKIRTYERTSSYRSK
jgi:hypothetical protein